MDVIDADAHVDENEETWQFMTEEERQFCPVTLVREPTEGNPSMQHNRFWLVDGRIRIRRVRSDEITGTTLETRELKDIGARLRHMDELGIDVQVLYPTMMLGSSSDKPEIDVALCRSYNRWIAERCAESSGRLRWIAVIPWYDIAASIEQVNFARANGACGILKRGWDCRRACSDPYFFPVYRAAERVDLPVCLHVGTGEVEYANPAYAGAGNFGRSTLMVIEGFHTIVSDDVIGRFPKLRFGFIEALSSWVPYLMTELEATPAHHSPVANIGKGDLSSRGLFVACQVTEDLPYIIQTAGENSLLLGTDYSHADRAKDLIAHRELLARGDISNTAKQAIISENPSRFYAMSA